MVKSVYKPRVITQAEFEDRELEMMSRLAEKIVVSTKNQIPKQVIMKVIDHLIAVLDDNGYVWKDIDWPYFDRRETNAPGKCSMLDMNLKIEKKPGIILHIHLGENVKLK